MRVKLSFTQRDLTAECLEKHCPQDVSLPVLSNSLNGSGSWQLQGWLMSFSATTSFILGRSRSADGGGEGVNLSRRNPSQLQASRCKRSLSFCFGPIINYVCFLEQATWCHIPCFLSLTFTVRIWKVSHHVSTTQGRGLSQDVQ